MAVDGVSCEPFSEPNSLLTGKNTGNFVNFAPGILPTEFPMMLNTRE